MRARLVRPPLKLKRARPKGAAPASRRGLATRPCGCRRTSGLVDVYVDLVGNVDVRGLAAEAELAAEDEQQHEHDDDQQDHGQNAATSAAAISRFDHGRVFALNVVAVIIGHETLPAFPCYIGETNEDWPTRFRARERR